MLRAIREIGKSFQYTDAFHIPLQVHDEILVPVREILETVKIGYNTKLLEDFTGYQHLADNLWRRIFVNRIGASETGAKRFLVDNPRASENWSQALKIKLAESRRIEEDRKIIEDGRHWDPYGNWDD